MIEVFGVRGEAGALTAIKHIKVSMGSDVQPAAHALLHS
jgi:hypothetical protein